MLLTAADEAELVCLAATLRAAGLTVGEWREPDWDGTLTALAVEPGSRSGRLLSCLPLTLREPVPA